MMGMLASPLLFGGSPRSRTTVLLQIFNYNLRFISLYKVGVFSSK